MEILQIKGIGVCWRRQHFKINLKIEHKEGYNPT